MTKPNIIGRRFFLSNPKINLSYLAKNEKKIYPEDIRVLGYNKYTDMVQFRFNDSKESDVDKNLLNYKMSLDELFISYSSIKPDMIFSICITKDKHDKVDIEYCISRYVDDVYNRKDVLKQSIFRMKLSKMIKKEPQGVSYGIFNIKEIPLIEWYVFRDTNNDHFIVPMEEKILKCINVYGYYGDDIYDLIDQISGKDKVEIEEIVNYLGRKSNMGTYGIGLNNDEINILQSAYDIISDIYEVKHNIDDTDRKTLSQLLYCNPSPLDLNRPIIQIDRIDNFVKVEIEGNIEKTRQKIREWGMIPLVTKHGSNIADDLYSNLSVYMYNYLPIVQNEEGGLSDDEITQFMNNAN